MKKKYSNDKTSHYSPQAFSSANQSIDENIHNDNTESLYETSSSLFPTLSSISSLLLTLRTPSESSLQSTGTGFSQSSQAYNIIWVRDDTSKVCMVCFTKFTMINRRHHCRACGYLVCALCSRYKQEVKGLSGVHRICKKCVMKDQYTESAVVTKELPIEITTLDQNSIMTDFATESRTKSSFKEFCPYISNDQSGNLTDIISVLPHAECTDFSKTTVGNKANVSISEQVSGMEKEILSMSQFTHKSLYQVDEIKCLQKPVCCVIS